MKMKTIDEILTLIERFFEGDTSLEEEQWLYDYFKQTKDLPQELEAYREMFLDFDAITLGDASSVEMTEAEPTNSLPKVEQTIALNPPKYRSLWKQVVGIAAMIAIIVGSVWSYQTYQDIQLQNIYGGSYVIVDGKRIDNLREILPEIKSTLSLADAYEAPSPTDLINQAEQDLLNHIQDAQERERIQALLNQ